MEEQRPHRRNTAALLGRPPPGSVEFVLRIGHFVDLVYYYLFGIGGDAVKFHLTNGSW